MNPVIGKIRKLMAMANPANGAATGEVENALRLIDKLMRDNNLSMSAIMASSDSINVNEGEGIRFNRARGFTKILAVAVSTLCETHLIRRRQKFQIWEEYIFVGTAHDVDLSREIFQLLMDQIIKGSDQFDTAVERREYSEGFSLIILERADKAKEKRACDTGALVFVGKKQAAIKDHVDKMNLGKERLPRIDNQKGDAFFIGANDGQKADLHPKRKVEHPNRRELSHDR